MLSKIVVLFLIGMAVLAMFGKWRVGRRPPEKRQAARCSRCGTTLVGRGPCVCEKKGR
jgi:hypothetical protein